MATKRGQSLRAGGGGHGMKTPAPKLPKVAQKTLTAPSRTPGGKGSPGGDHGRLHRKYNPPQPAVRTPTHTITIPATTGKRPTTVHVRVTPPPAATKTAVRPSATRAAPAKKR